VKPCQRFIVGYQNEAVFISNKPCSRLIRGSGIVADVNRTPSKLFIPVPNHNRRKLLKGLAGGGALAITSPFAWAGLWEPYHPVVERVRVNLKNLPAGFDGCKIALLSDLHIQPGWGPDKLKPALQRIAEERPDMVFLLGDYANDREPNKEEYLKQCAHVFAGVTAPLGVWAIWGNHDYPSPPSNPASGPWREAGITTLTEEIAEVNRSGDRVFLVGLHSFLQRPTHPAPLLKRLPVNSCRIVLWHEPDRADDAAWNGADLQVSGHTHGGQVKIPFWGTPFLPAGGRRFASGLYQTSGMPLYVTRGVGLLPPFMRFACPPEVTILTLKVAG
jgi:hypothetical protein